MLICSVAASVVSERIYSSVNSFVVLVVAAAEAEALILVKAKILRDQEK